MLPPRRILLAGALVGLLVAGAVAGLAAAQPGALRIGNVRFVKSEVKGDNLTLDAIAYFSSLGGTSRDIRVEVYLYPQSTGLAEQRDDVHVGRVPAATTNEVRIPLHLAGFNASRPLSWSVDFLVFEDGLLTQEGHGNIGYRGGDIGSGRALDVAASVSAFQRVP